MADDLKKRLDVIFDERERQDAAARAAATKSQETKAEQDRGWDLLVTALIEPVLNEFSSLLGDKSVTAIVEKTGETHHNAVALRIERGSTSTNAALVKFMQFSDTVKIDTEPTLAGPDRAIPAEWLRGRPFAELDRDLIEDTVLHVIDVAVSGSR